MGTPHASAREESARAALELGEREARTGDLAEALVLLDNARRLYADLGDRSGTALAAALLGHTLALRGDHERAAALLDGAVAKLPAGEPALASRIEALAAAAQARAGAWERARAGLTRARALAEQAAASAATLAAIDAALAEGALAAGDVETARGLALQAVAAARDPLTQGRALAAQAAVCFAGGDSESADRLYRQATVILGEGGELRALAEASLAHGLMLGAAGSADAARTLARAHTLFRSQGATRDVTRAREALRRFGRRATDRVGAVALAARRLEVARARKALVAAARAGDPAGIEARAADLARADDGLDGAVDALIADREGAQTMLDLLRTLAATPGAQQLPLAIARAAADLTGAERVVVALRDEAGELALASSLRAGEGDDWWRAPAQAASAARGAPAFVTRSLIVAPLRRGNELFGAVTCDKGISGGPFAQRDLELLVGFASQAAVILENARAAEALRVETRARAATLEAISDGVLSIDMAGVVTSWNTAAARMLGRPGAPPPVSLAPWAELDEVVSSDHDVDARPVALAGGSCLCSTRVIRDDSGQAVGRVAVLCELRRAARLGERVTGAAPVGTFADLLGETAVFQRQIKLAAGAAGAASPILISGEIGTGKRLLARAIHRASPRAGGPLVVVECGSLPRDSLEEVLFGTAQRPGKVELAGGGSLVLVEVGELPAPAQARLARLLVEGVLPMPGYELTPDIRILATTSHEPGARFNRELLQRLRAVRIDLPPLRERPDDLPLLIAHLLRRSSQRLGKAVQNVSPEVEDALRAYSWPGNVRELEQVLEAEAQAAPIGLEILIDVPAMILPGAALPPESSRGLRSILEAEHQLLVNALRQHRGNVPRVARSLGVSRGTVYNMMRKFRVDPSTYRVS